MILYEKGGKRPYTYYDWIPQPKPFTDGTVEKAQKGEKMMYYDYFPALKNTRMQVIPDEEFTREKTGMGSIEYMPSSEQTVKYPTGYAYTNPNYGKAVNTIVYNPNESDQQDVALDMVSHGLADEDPEFAKLKKNYGDIIRKMYGGDINYFYKKAAKEGYTDSKSQFEQNFIDGKLRNMLFKGSPKDYDRARYYYGEEEEQTKIPGIKDAINKIRYRLGTQYINY